MRTCNELLRDRVDVLILTLCFKVVLKLFLADFSGC